MIFHRLGLINKNQLGFTLIEIMLVIAITGIITGGFTMTIFQVIDGNIRTSNHMTAVRQVQSAGYWVSHDAQMAQKVDATGASGFLTLTWVGWEYKCVDNTCIDVYEVCYTYDGASGKIQRHQKITTNKYDAEGHLVGTTKPENLSCVAQYIAHTPTVTMDGNELTVVITASVGEAEEERTYEITPRASP
ncbi:hypothetical protein ES705_28954 [subsurface metagenome]